VTFDLPLVILGAVGGVVPDLVRLAKRPNTVLQDLKNPNLYASLVILAILGALASFIFQATSLKEALGLGIAAPSLISNLGARQPPAQAADQQPVFKAQSARGGLRSWWGS
jgi:hypothetical protein